MHKITTNYTTKVYLKQKNGHMKPFLVNLMGQDICFYKEGDEGST